MSFHVEFVFKSNSTRSDNPPRFRGTFVDVRRATGVVVPNSPGTVRGIRGSDQTNAEAVALCG
jgi:hypothetical protein